MQTKAPKLITFILSFILFAIAFLLHYSALGFLSPLAPLLPWFWMAAWFLLALGVLIKGL